MKTTYVLDFSPPMEGLTGVFSTMRLGLKFSRCLAPGDRVLMIERPRSILIGVAVVQQVEVGTLRNLSQRWATTNHNQRGLDAAGAPGRLVQNMIRRYGPHKCGENSKVTMILLMRER